MNAALALLLDEMLPTLGLAFYVFLRVGAAMALLPAFGEQSIPMRVRLGLAIVFTVVVMPVVVTPNIPGQFGPLAGLAEVMVGLVLGMVLRLFVLALQIAGAIAAQSTSLSQIMGGSAGTDPQPAIGHLLTIGGLTLAIMAGLHIRLAIYLIDSYSLFPFGQMPRPEQMAEIGLARIGATFAQGFGLAAPFVVAALIYNVTLGVINRAMPQLMVSFVGAPVITAGALGLLAISAPLLLGYWVEGLNHFLADPVGAF